VPGSDLALGCGQESDPDTGRNKKRPTRVDIAQGLRRDINVLIFLIFFRIIVNN
jgi:hypothetical protein